MVSGVRLSDGAPRKRRMKPIRCFFVLSIEGTFPLTFCYPIEGTVGLAFSLSIEGTFPLAFCFFHRGYVPLGFFPPRRAARFARPFCFFPPSHASAATKKGKNKRKRSENLSNPLTKKRGRAILTHEIANALQFRPTKCENMVFLRDMDLTKSKAGAILY